jgi:2-C-methyl-D-erythritol 2,4-cyclodiphosphate synthase
VSTYRVGSGFDTHRLVAGRPLVLGGIQVPHERGLEGHSDGDCLIHAICDALLGAAGAGDMGRHFPSTDPRWKGIAGIAFLNEVAHIVTAAGYAIENIDATVIAQGPPLAPHLDEMAANIAHGLGVEHGIVSVKAKSTDGLGAIGRAEGIAAQAVALLRRDL